MSHLMFVKTCFAVTSMASQTSANTDQYGVAEHLLAANEGQNSYTSGGMIVSSVAGDLAFGKAIFVTQDGLIASGSPDKAGLKLPSDRSYTKVTETFTQAELSTPQVTCMCGGTRIKTLLST